MYPRELSNAALPTVAVIVSSMPQSACPTTPLVPGVNAMLSEFAPTIGAPGRAGGAGP